MAEPCGICKDAFRDGQDSPTTSAGRDLFRCVACRLYMCCLCAVNHFSKGDDDRGELCETTISIMNMESSQPQRAACLRTVEEKLERRTHAPSRHFDRISCFVPVPTERQSSAASTRELSRGRER